MQADDSNNPLGSVKSEEALIALQRVFAEIIRRPLASDDEMLPDERAEQFILPSQTLSAHERLELYARQYWWRLMGSFNDDFKTVRSVLGKERFRELTEAYLSRYKSSSYTLRHLGRSFVAFLKESPELIAEYPVCLDIAQIEWAQMEVAFEIDCAPLQFADLQTEAESLRFALQPSVRLLELAYPAHVLIEAKTFQTKQVAQELSNTITEGGEMSEESSEAHSLPDPRQTFLAIHRHNSGIYIKELNLPQFVLLRELGAGNELEASCQEAGKHDPDRLLDQNLGSWFQDWVSLGWLVKAES